MSQSKPKLSNPGSDECLYNLINSSSINHNVEATMLQEAFATRIDKEANPKCNPIIRLEIIINLILIGAAILVQFTHNTCINNSELDLQRVGIKHEIKETQNQ
ncbi:MAG: hypothetical protein QNJ70_27765 [Xenococcaceae cyanobacterium MO_207.B15]|nr:hypothetical protein [Xenococcaceae cyanobacterium MO_207.B15]